MKALLFLIAITYSSLAFTHNLKCEIYDLPSGENLIETKNLVLGDADLNKSNSPFVVSLNHDLIVAEFRLSYLSIDTLLFQITTREVVNAEFAEFKIATKGLPKGRFQKLGHLSTELTGIGNNTLSQCFILYNP